MVILKADDKGDYLYLRAWNLMFNAFPHYIQTQLDTARAENAPETAIWRDMATKRWSTWDEIDANNPIKEHVASRVRALQAEHELYELEKARIAAEVIPVVVHKNYNLEVAYDQTNNKILSVRVNGNAIPAETKEDGWEPMDIFDYKDDLSTSSYVAIVAICDSSKKKEENG